MPVAMPIHTGPDMPFILLPTHVNGSGPYDFVLDTGAGRTMLTASLAKRAHVEPQEAKEARGIGGARLTARLGVASEISVADRVVRGVDVAILDALPKCTGGAGALGYSFLHDSFTAIDYPDGKLAFHDPCHGVPREFRGCAHVPLRLASPTRPVVFVTPRMSDGLDCAFLLDTGASSTLISPRLAARLGLARHADGQVIGAAGGLEAYAAELPAFRLGNWRIESLEAQIADAFGSLSEAVGVPIDGILGYDVLSRFRVGLDYANERLYLAE